MLPQDESHNTDQQRKQHEPTQYGETLTIAPPQPDNAPHENRGTNWTDQKPWSHGAWSHGAMHVDGRIVTKEFINTSETIHFTHAPPCDLLCGEMRQIAESSAARFRLGNACGNSSPDQAKFRCCIADAQASDRDPSKSSRVCPIATHAPSSPATADIGPVTSSSSPCSTLDAYWISRVLSYEADQAAQVPTSQPARRVQSGHVS